VVVFLGFSFCCVVCGAFSGRGHWDFKLICVYFYMVVSEGGRVSVVLCVEIGACCGFLIVVFLSMVIGMWGPLLGGRVGWIVCLF